MGVKLTGEYQVVDDGVVVEGKIDGSHIYDLAQLFKVFGTISLYAGQSKDGIAEQYKVPHPGFRSYIMSNGLFSYEDEKDILKGINPDTLPYNARPYFREGSVVLNWLGVQYNHGDGRNIIDQREVIALNGRSRRVKRLLTNSAWVWGVKADGTFGVKLRGLANRHMMTMVVGNALKMANHLEAMAVKCLDKPEKFSKEAIRGNY